MLSLKAISVLKEPFFLSDVSFDVSERENTVILGGAGSGKTLLLRAILGLEELESGSAQLRNVEITPLNLVSMRQSIGFVSSYGVLFPHLTVSENICLAAEHVGWKEEEISNRLLKLTERFNFGLPKLSLTVSELTPAERQTIAFIRALMLSPELIIFDDPFLQFDPAQRRELEGKWQAILKEMNKTSIWATRDVCAAQRLGERILFLHEGKVLENARQSVFFQTENEKTKQYLNAQSLQETDKSTMMV